MDKQKSAGALRYKEGSPAPEILAAGKGAVAEKIIELAEQAGIAIREDPILAEALAGLEVGTEIPPELYLAVAEALVWAWHLDQQTN